MDLRTHQEKNVELFVNCGEGRTLREKNSFFFNGVVRLKTRLKNWWRGLVECAAKGSHRPLRGMRAVNEDELLSVKLVKKCLQSNETNLDVCNDDRNG